MSDFYSLKFQNENQNVAALLDAINHIAPDFDKAGQHARVLVETVRQRSNDLKGFNALIQTHDLTSQEGLALMTLAEALLRIPDKETINALIEDKLSDGDWTQLFEQSATLTARISGLGLSFSQKVMGSLIGKLGMPVIRKACLEAMAMMGHTFVLGRNINEAIDNAAQGRAQGYCFSYDMLGEGARTSKDATYYFEAYCHAIETIGKAEDNSNLSPLHRSGVSVKLSALYPRYENAHKGKAMAILSDRLTHLCKLAAQYHLNLTIDAEECDRLALSLDIIESVLPLPLMQQWDGFGLAVQAYQKRALEVIERVMDWTDRYQCKLGVRLVKGAYWDTEIKHAQLEGHPDYPVYTRKENTDLSYLVCAEKLLKHRDKVFPLFGTHNAHTVATIMDMAGDNMSGFMFQRLHGMGEQLYNQILTHDIPVSVYAPVGTYKYLLAYLVRRLLENGANSSFVNKVYDRNIAIDDLIRNPVDEVQSNRGKHYHPLIPLPLDLYKQRRNSHGLDLSEDKPVQPLLNHMEAMADKTHDAACIINGTAMQSGAVSNNLNPSNRHDVIGKVYEADKDMIDTAYTALHKAFQSWNATPIETRAAILEKIADLYEENTLDLMNLVIREAGKTIPDAIAEIREAVDFCRYYAVEARKHFTEQELEGPTGERNTLRLEGRGIFACISPWNFPLAIFTGQVVAALVAGNCVIAKPAEQTPAIATFAIQLMLKAGLPNTVIALIHGGGSIGETIIKHDRLGGVAFTGSTAAAKSIHRALAAKDGPICPLIAETGGLNAMIVDSSALPEQVTDDVLWSAFGSAGQRCSALRILCVQDDVADEIIPMIRGAIEHLTVGDPSYLSTDVGPIIDEDAKQRLEDHISDMKQIATRVTYSPYDSRLDSYGTFLPPVMMEIASPDDINAEAFGPVLHVIRYKEEELETIINKLNAKGFGLTFGLHSRIHERQDRISQLINAGNIYINRGQTGAVVGVQPFGGRGLSGTGPKAGGPYYLHAFATEKSISDNITASGGNATLVNL